ncbi:MAG TPA: hypothetical protein VN721_08605 [Flavipsychrobacter sp.]|nr:hypothetical protein [Flavipsychrobacter sp.]
MYYRTYTISLLLLFPFVASSQTFTQQQKDSLRELSCTIEKADQAIRHSFDAAKESKDTNSIDSIGAVMYKIDLHNFQILDSLITTIGFPCPKLLGKGTCYPFAVLIHWAKEYPEWFNDPRIVPLFKREIEKGNLPLCQMDFAQFAYTSYMKPDIKYYQLTNAARVAYGLKPYSKKQYLGIERVEPLMQDPPPKTYTRVSN